MQRAERSELLSCDFHLVDPDGVVLRVIIAVKLDGSIQLRCAYGIGIEGRIDVFYLFQTTLRTDRREGAIGLKQRRFRP